jgi:hypothetical protein
MVRPPFFWQAGAPSSGFVIVYLYAFGSPVRALCSLLSTDILWLKYYPVSTILMNEFLVSFMRESEKVHHILLPLFWTEHRLTSQKNSRLAESYQRCDTSLVFVLPWLDLSRLDMPLFQHPPRPTFPDVLLNFPFKATGAQPGRARQCALYAQLADRGMHHTYNLSANWHFLVPQNARACSFGLSWRSSFTEPNPIPFAAASIGQVHQAVFVAAVSPSGQPECIAVKIQQRACRALTAATVLCLCHFMDNWLWLRW